MKDNFELKIRVVNGIFSFEITDFTLMKTYTITEDQLSPSDFLDRSKELMEQVKSALILIMSGRN